MNLVVDFGNTYAKMGIFQGERLIQRLDRLEEDELINLIEKNKPQNILIGSVRKEANPLKEKLNNNFNCQFLSHTTALPIKNEYLSPATLGVDRLAAVVGANFHFPENNCLVIDIGTCITYDFIDMDARYWGGSISPGIRIKLKAMHTFTAKLPLVHFKEDFKLIGQNTEESILSGVLNGTLSEIEEMINKFSNKFKDLKVIICGGDANFFESRIKASIFVKPDLVLIGLNRILQHNVSK